METAKRQTHLLLGIADKSSVPPTFTVSFQIHSQVFFAGSLQDSTYNFFKIRIALQGLLD